MIPELRESLRLFLEVEPDADSTIQLGVDLAETDVPAYLDATTPAQRIHIGEQAKLRGMIPGKVIRWKHTGRWLGERMVDLMTEQPDTAFRDAVYAEHSKED